MGGKAWPVANRNEAAAMVARFRKTLQRVTGGGKLAFVHVALCLSSYRITSYQILYLRSTGNESVVLDE